MAGAPDSLDPFKTVTGTSTPITYATYDTLVQYNPKTKAYIGVVAKSWEVTPASIKFQLRSDVKCRDGSALTPTDIAASLRAYMDPKTGSPYATRWLGRAPLTFTADDAGSTLTITAAKPFGALLAGLKMVPLVCPAGLKDRAKLASGAEGSGPYELADSKPGISYTLKLRDDYTWGPNGMTSGAPGVPETIILKVINSDATAANELLAGTVDVSGLGGVDAQRVQGNKSIAKTVVATQGQWSVVGNMEAGHVTADPEVRHALFQAIDRRALLLAYLGATASDVELGTSVLPPNMPGYDESTKGLVPEFSPDAAKATLSAAGWTESGGQWTKDGKVLQVRVIGVAGWGNANEYLASQLKNIGVDVKLSVTDDNGWLADLSGGNYDITIFPIDNSIEAPTGVMPFYVGALPPTGTNFIRNSDAELSALADKASASVGAEADKLWASVQTKLLRGYDLLPWQVPVTSVYSSSDVTLLVNGLPSTLAIRRIKG
ncbi:ABC transporter substrate-binding protein [Microtetraspora malaysiensis]|uniref:ABC transporter substrate-binding protein n=1 Tax=Microtetraspora malaysiensis TaxID=161358 RepID=UPI003D8AC2A1